MQNVEHAVRNFMMDIAESLVEIGPRHGLRFTTQEAWRIVNHMFAAAVPKDVKSNPPMELKPVLSGMADGWQGD